GEGRGCGHPVGGGGRGLELAGGFVDEDAHVVDGERACGGFEGVAATGVERVGDLLASGGCVQPFFDSTERPHEAALGAIDVDVGIDDVGGDFVREVQQRDDTATARAEIQRLGGEL